MEMTKPFNRGKPSRILVAFLSVLFALPAGWGLFAYWVIDHKSDDPDWLLRILLNVSMDLVGILFVISMLGVVWAVFVPPWIEKLLGKFLTDVVNSLAMLFAIVLTMLVVSYFTIYRN